MTSEIDTHSLHCSPQDADPDAPLPSVPWNVTVELSRSMAQYVHDNMPSRVCAVCSCMTNAAASRQLTWDNIPNVEILRADIDPTAAVPRAAHTVHWRQLPPGQNAPPPPHPPPLPFGYRAKPMGLASCPESGDVEMSEPPAVDPTQVAADAVHRLQILQQRHGHQLVRPCLQAAPAKQPASLLNACPFHAGT
jgi:hypothetical protein